MTYLDLYAQRPEVYFAALAVMLAITLIAYGIFPILFSKIRKKPITAKKFRITCYAVNLIPLAFFLVISEKPSFFPYLVWTSVFSSAGIKLLKKKNILVDAISKDNAEQPKINTSSLHDIVDTPIDTSIDEKNDSVCKFQKTDSFGEQCGNPIESKTKKCTGCGKHIFHCCIKLSTVLLLTITVVFIIITIILYKRYDQYQHQIIQYQSQILQLNETVDELKKALLEKESTIAESNESQKSTPDNSSYGTEPVKTLIPQASPVSGTISIGRPYDSSKDSKITVHASYRDCVVKLKTEDGTCVLSFFVRAGETASVGVPPKALYVYFAEGIQWYGWSNYFGEETYYYKDLNLADFSNYTYEYTLFKVEDGNLSLTEIDKDDF